jgi:putative ABC transport system permease protein
MSFSKYHENIAFAFFMIRSYKFRSFLTLIGIIVGVWTIIVITSIINGIDTTVKQQIDSFGPEAIFISKTKSVGVRTGKITVNMRNRRGITFDDAMAIKELPALKISVPFLNVSNDYQGDKIAISTKNIFSLSTRLEGTIPDYMESGQETLSSGRFFTNFENEIGRRVCVLRSKAALNFFPDEEPVGKTLKIGGEVYQVVGVLAYREQMFGGGSGVNDLNNGIFIPFKRAQSLKPSVKDIFILGVAQKDRLDEAIAQIKNLLRNRRNLPQGEEDDFEIASPTGVFDEFRSLTLGIAILMVLVSSIGLLVGGIGVMNIMLISVTERTREIGLRKAIGAKRQDIRIQFLVEAVTLSFIGGMVGLLLGWISNFIIQIFIPSKISFGAFIGGIIVSFCVGVLSGYLPARRAAKVDPITALRFE